MKILAIESSGLVAGVAVLTEDTCIAEYTVHYKKTHSQTLLPMLDEISRMVELDLKEIDTIAVCTGPGSFTGLRIGSATAKGLGQALGKPLIGVPTLEGLAYNLYGAAGLVCPLMDARRNQTYTGLYRFVKEKERYRLCEVVPQCAVPLEEIIEKVNAEEKEVVFLGDGVPVFQQQLRKLLRVPYSFAPASCNRQRAASIGSLAFVYAEEGRFCDPKEHRPEYLRLSQAERERNQRLAREAREREGEGV